MPMATKLDRVVTYCERLPYSHIIFSPSHLVRLPNKLNCYISTSNRPIATKHGMPVTYHETLPPIKLHDPLNTWLHEGK